MEGLLIHFGEHELFIHQSILIWIVICIFVTVLLVWAGSKIKKADPTKAPKGVVLVFEQLVNMCSMVLKGNLNEQTWKYLPAMGTIMIVMVISNLMGLIGLQPPTGNMSVTITLTVLAIILIHGSDIKKNGLKGKLKAWCDPTPFLMPLNVIGDLATPVSLTLRLFGNILGGTIIIGLLYMLLETLLNLFVPFGALMYVATPFLHMYFDIFTAFMQTYIFFTLVSFYLADAIGSNED